MSIETLDPVRELNRLTGEALKRGEDLEGLEGRRQPPAVAFVVMALARGVWIGGCLDCS